MTDSPAPRRIALIFGGVSPEHDISILSASQVAEGLLKVRERTPHDVQGIYINNDGKFVWDSELNPTLDRIANAKHWELETQHPENDVLSFPHAIVRLATELTDIAMLILHGPGGEDGKLQAALDLTRIAYTGSGASASALALNKPHTQAVFNAAGIPIARSVVIGPGGTSPASIVEAVGLPCVVKPASGGSSVGVSIACEPEEVKAAIELALTLDEAVMVEKFIVGREMTCGVLEVDGQPVALPVTEILPPEGRFFDYDAKYQPGVSREVTPAEIPPATMQEIQRLARQAHLAVGCRGFSRTDFILASDGKPIALEINTIPGMTATSLLPQQAAVVGISFDQLLEKMLENSMHD